MNIDLVAPDPSRRDPQPDDLAVVQYWDAEEVPDYIAAEVATFVDMNPGFQHLLFSESAAEEFIAEHFGGRELAAFRACGVPAMQADYFRLCAGLVLGGVYVDVDFRCIAPLAPIVPDPGKICLFRATGGNVFSGLLAFRAAGHPFFELALEISTANIERRFPDSVYHVAGPPIFFVLAALHRAGSLDEILSKVKGPRFRAILRAYLDVIGDYDRVTVAFQGVEIQPPGAHLDFVRPSADFAYKSTESHWLNFKGDIFRTR
jgi:hypothetical protein